VSLASTDDKWYRAGEAVLFDVTFDAAVTVIGTPALSLTVGSATRSATYVSGSGTTTLRFAYSVVTDDTDPDGLQFSATTVTVPANASITNSGGNVLLAFVPPDITGVRVDATSPTIVAPIVVPVAGNYRLGDTLQFAVTFSESVRVTPDATNGNVPRIALVVGSTTRQAGYVAGTETPVLVFDYVVQSSDLDTNGIIVSTAVSLNGATITDLAGNATALTFSPPPTNTVLVDGVAPTVNRFSTSKPNGRYRVGESMTIVATMSEAVRAGSSIEVTLSTGTLLMLSTATNASTLTGTYVVQAGENTNDLTISSYTDEGVFDLFGNALGGTAVPAGGNNIAGSRDIVIDTDAPFVTAFTSTTADGFYRVGTPVGGITITATISEAVRANSSFAVTLNSGAVVTLSTIAQGTTLTGTYVIANGDNSNDLTVTTFNAGSLLDLAGNPFSSFTPPLGTNIADTKALVIDTVAPLPPTTPVEHGTTRLLGGFLDAAEAAVGDLTVRVALGSSGAVTGDRLDLLLNGSPFATAPKFVTLSSQNVTDGFVDFTVTIADLGLDGQKQLTAQLTDRAGNLGMSSQALSFSLDRDPPAAPAIAIVSGITPAVSRIEATQSPGLISVSGEPAASFAITFTRGPTSISKPVAAGAPRSIALTSADVDALGNGLVMVEATQTDQAGNPQAGAPPAPPFPFPFWVPRAQPY